MSKTCTTEKTAQRQRWIENGLLELMQHKKFDQISVTELCGHLGLGRRSFYRYFQDIDDVLDSLLHHVFQDFAAPDAVPDLRECEQSFCFWQQHKDLLAALSHSNMIGRLVEYALRYMPSDSIGNYLTAEDLQTDIRKETNLFIITGFISLLIAWYADGFRKTPAQMAAITRRMLFQPLLRE